jgi:hypothetical protein
MKCKTYSLYTAVSSRNPLLLSASSTACLIVMVIFNIRNKFNNINIRHFQHTCKHYVVKIDHTGLIFLKIDTKNSDIINLILNLYVLKPLVFIRFFDKIIIRDFPFFKIIYDF